MQYVVDGLKSLNPKIVQKHMGQYSELSHWPPLLKYQAINFHRADNKFIVLD